MALIKYSNIGITAISACVPKKISSNYNLNKYMKEEALLKLIHSIGIKEKRIASRDVCTSDLCYSAAEQMLKDNDVDKESIDMVIFLSLTPDYITPSTSNILQHRLKLPKSAVCLDISLACSGFVYALSTAFAFASNPEIDKVLVLVGETLSKVTNTKDMVSYPLFGDAGTACIVEKGNFEESFFLLTSDGSGKDIVKIPHGGFRNPVNVESLADKIRENGNVRKDVEFTMDGLSTFNTAISTIPKQITFLLNKCNIEKSKIDYLVPHQGNKFMIDFIVKRLGFDQSKVPYCLEKYGNVSSASIPLTIVTELENKLMGDKYLLLASIGAGWSYGTAYIQTKDISVTPLLEI